ncbi:MAG: TIGR01459 family HAD-type hydrolase [Sneathiella sp.]|nr:TIGR01459 family HAD-type hydrolase [Sneathiella sp.]
MSFEIIPGLSQIAPDYNGFILDLWGVVHNGHAPYPGVLVCMTKLREGGKPIILLSNAPRTNGFVIEFLEKMGVTRSFYDHILTSGDITRQVLERRTHKLLEGVDQKFYQIGAIRDKGLEDGLAYSRVSSIAEAGFIICTGLVNDEIESPDDYLPLLQQALDLDLPMLCANPDLTVMRGQKSIYCAGSIAALYEQMGGRVELFGKPYPEVYRQAMGKLGIGDAKKILAVGDSMRTDIRGAAGAGMDSVLVGGGIHAEEWGLKSGQAPSADQIAAIAKLHDVVPTYVIGHMVW